MHSLPTYLQFSRDVWLGIGVGFVAAVALLSIFVWLSRRRYVIIGNSPAADMVTYQLGRIADTLDTISVRGFTLQNPVRTPQQAPELQPGIRGSREPLEESVPNETQAPVTVPAEEKRVPSHRLGTSVLGL